MSIFKNVFSAGLAALVCAGPPLAAPPEDASLGTTISPSGPAPSPRAAVAAEKKPGVSARAADEPTAEQLRFDRALSKLKSDGIGLRAPAGGEAFYRNRSFHPAWSTLKGPRPDALSMLEIVNQANAEGLRPADYHAREIGEILGRIREGRAPAPEQLMVLDLLLTDAFLHYGSHLLSGRTSSDAFRPRSGLAGRSRDLPALLKEALAGQRVAHALRGLRPHPERYGRLMEALVRYRELARQGGWPTVTPGPKLEPGARGPRVAELRARLNAADERSAQSATGDRVGGAAAAPSTPPVEVFDQSLAAAVKRFQRRHGLQVDGVVGPRTLAALNVPVSERVQQIELNLERLRWLPDSLGERYLLVNIPDYRVLVMEGETPVMESRAVVGKTKRQTPVFSGTMSYLVLSPRWNVPSSIAIKDKLPLLRRDPYALYHRGIHIYDAQGQEVNPGEIDWHEVGGHNFPYRLRQEPGAGNALGKIKFMFPNAYQVYLHDTPQTHLFRRAERAYSSGCVRIDKPIELAEYLLKSNGRWSRKAIVAASRGRRERHVNLPDKIPVHLLYWTAWVDEDGTVNFRKDIYKRDQALAKALAATG